MGVIKCVGGDDSGGDGESQAMMVVILVMKAAMAVVVVEVILVKREMVKNLLKVRAIVDFMLNSYKTKGPSETKFMTWIYKRRKIFVLYLREASQGTGASR